MLSTAYRFLAYYGTMACFGVFALGFNLRWTLARRGGDPMARERAVQQAIHQLFRRLAQWLAFTRLVKVEYRGFGRLPGGGVVVVANHPGLLDAMYVIARLPAAFCVFKPSVRHNPLLGPAAVRAGYLPSDRRLTLIRSAAAKIRAGGTFVVFPEGTRTPAGGTIRPFKPGFAAIARRAGAPVQLIRITVDGCLLTKEQAWWRLPRLPARVVLEAGPCLDPAEAGSTSDLVAQAEGWFRDATASATPPAFEAFPGRSSSLTLTVS